MEDQQAARDPLSGREKEILELLSTGLSDQEIAARLYLSVNTIRWYNRQLYSKLGVGSRTQAIAHAKDLGLLEKTATVLASPQPRPNLPIPSAPFIGRSREIAEVRRLLETSRLLTLTGVGGIGKTRLALQVVADLVNDFGDGIYFVDLAPINDPALVVKTIMIILGVPEQPGKALIDSLIRALAGRKLLLLVDNFEHVITAAPLLSDLLAASPHLRVIVTSREALRLSGEQEYPVPLLSLPPTDAASIQEVASSEACALFIHRAQMMQPHFALTDENAPVVAQICKRLEGLPLAIELAAVRCKLLTPSALLDRLDSRLRMLTGGSRDAPPRQRTLRDTLEWSYNLLNADEKTLFARMAIFRGGASLEGIEVVCGYDLSIDLLDTLSSLVDKSLVQQKETVQGEPRFTMLETIHEYASEQLITSGEAEAIRHRHTCYFVELAERAEPEMRTAPHMYWFQRFELEQDNIRELLAWSLGEGDVSFGVRLASGLWLFWFAYGHHVEGQYWTQRLLVHLDKTPKTQHARFLIGAGNLAMTSDLEQGKSLLMRTLETARGSGDKLNVAWALAHMAITSSSEAMTVAEEALSLFRELKHQPGIAYALNIIGEITRRAGDDSQARRAYEECLEVCLRTGETRRVGIMYFNLAFLAQHEGNHTAALDLTQRALFMARDTDNRKEMAWCLPIAAGSIAALGQPQRAARLLGMSESFLESLGAFNLPADKQEFDRIRVEVCTQLGDADFQSALEEGRKMTLEQAVAVALHERK